MYLHEIKIGNLLLKSNIFIAPLAGYTNLPTRVIYKEQGGGIAYTEMISAIGLHYSFDKSIALLKSNELDKPLGVQLFGPDAKSIVDAFLKIKNYKFDLIDINCGCSVKKVLKTNSGATLLKNPNEIFQIIKALKDNTDKPVTIKIRSGWDDKSINYLKVLDAAVRAGASLITFHPRTRAQMFKSNADWGLIADMKKQSPIPVIGNGDIFSAEDAVNMLESTKCDGIMLARGLIENPFLVEEVYSCLSDIPYHPRSVSDRINMMLRHCVELVELIGEKLGIMEFRKFIKGYLKGIPNISILRQQLNEAVTYNEFERIIKNVRY